MSESVRAWVSGLVSERMMYVFMAVHASKSN